MFCVVGQIVSTIYCLPQASLSSSHLACFSRACSFSLRRSATHSSSMPLQPRYHSHSSPCPNVSNPQPTQKLPTTSQLNPHPHLPTGAPGRSSYTPTSTGHHGPHTGHNPRAQPAESRVLPVRSGSTAKGFRATNKEGPSSIRSSKTLGPLGPDRMRPYAAVTVLDCGTRSIHRPRPTHSLGHNQQKKNSLWRA